MGTSSLVEAWLWLQLIGIGIPYRLKSAPHSVAFSLELVPYGELRLKQVCKEARAQDTHLLFVRAPGQSYVALRKALLS